MSIFRFSAEFRFFFFTFGFFKNDFPLFLKNRREKILVSDTATLWGFQRASVNSHGHLGLPLRAPSVSGQSTKAPISTRHSKSDTRSHAKESRSQNLVTYSAAASRCSGRGRRVGEGGGGLVARGAVKGGGVLGKGGGGG